MENTKKHEIKGPKGLLSILAIQLAVMLYTVSSVCAKMAGTHPGSIRIFGMEISGLSPAGIRWLFLEVLCLGLYAVVWQQIIKRYDLSIAYANRAFAIFWTFIWSVLIFHEPVKPLRLIGIIIVFCGIMTVNSDVE